MLKKFIKLISIIFASLVIIFGIYLLFMTITDYKPADTVTLAINKNNKNMLKKDSTLSVLTFNIGYCGLDKAQDFFMDGGTGSRSQSEEKTSENLKAITDFVQKEDNSFILFQEVDLSSTRSFHIDQYAFLKDNLTPYNSTFAINYDVPWVPVPILKPHGNVKSGLSTFSKFKTASAMRFQYPGKEKWPRQLALLDRCFIESRIPVDDGSELVLLNSHLSAYDKGGLIRAQQLGFLKEYLTNEYKKGNYVVVGGDWNHLIPDTDPNIFENRQSWPEWLQQMPDDFKPEGFKWVADSSIPTNRTNDAPYINGQSYLSVIDGFLVSANIKIVSVNGHSLEFENTDHNPVTMEFMLQ